MTKLKKWIIAIIAFFLIICIILFSVSGIFLKQKYAEPWNKDYYKQYEDPRLQIIAHGILAPNSMNIQMWKFKMDIEDINSFYMFADAERDIISDIDYDDCIICQGTFVEYCIVAGKELGYEVIVNAFPNGEIDESNFLKSIKEVPVAKLTLKKSETVKSSLYDMIYKSGTVRNPFIKNKITEEDKNEVLESLNGYLNIKFQAIDDKFEAAGLRDLAFKAKEIEQSTKRVVEAYYSLTRTNEYVKNEKRYGLSIEANGDKGIKKHLLQGIATLMPFLYQGKLGKELELKKMKAALKSTDTFFFIKAEKTRLNQFNAGRAYSKFRLIAKTLNIGMQPLSQLNAKYPEMDKVRAEFEKNFDTNNDVILILRTGYYYKNKVNGMRRDLSEFIIT